MAFSTQTLNRALDIVNRHKTRNISDLDRRTAEIYEKKPELKELDARISELGCKLVRVSMSQNTGDFEQTQAELESLNSTRANIIKSTKISTELNYHCKRCKDTGYVNGNLCDCVISIAKQLVFEDMKQVMPIENSTFSNFNIDYYPDEEDENGNNPKKVAVSTLKICKEFADNFPSGQNLLLCGGCGLGKTHLSLAIANTVIEKGYSVIYNSAQSLISKITKEQFDFSSDTDITDTVLDCDLLILDDLGTEFNTQISASIVYNIINSRILKGLSTIISTNLTLKELEKNYTSRIVSRIIGNYTMRLLLGNDIRQLKLLK
ncbi:MAG: ATP-binding protein [bacterium]|nr:ATP-binding protein [bacterium]